MRGEPESRCLAWVREHLYGPDTCFFCRDWRKVAAMIECATPNLEASKFPDFVFEDGFIEHFQITAITASDVEMLRILDKYKEQISYIVFMDGHYCKVIDQQQISLIIKQTFKDIVFQASRWREIEGFSVIDITRRL